MANQVRALRKAIRAMRAADALNDSHAALEAAAVGLAEAVDDHPTSDALWREYRQALKALYEVGQVMADDDDGTIAFLELVRPNVRAQVGDSA